MLIRHVYREKSWILSITMSGTLQIDTHSCCVHRLIQGGKPGIYPSKRPKVSWWTLNQPLIPFVYREKTPNNWPTVGPNYPTPRPDTGRRLGNDTSNVKQAAGFWAERGSQWVFKNERSEWLKTRIDYQHSQEIQRQRNPDHLNGNAIWMIPIHL